MELRFAIVVSSVLGLCVLLLMPLGSIDAHGLHLTYKAIEYGADGKAMLACFGGAVLMGAISLRLGLRRWVAFLAAGCFAGAILELRPSLAGAPGPKIALATAALGLVAAAAGMILGQRA
jgi:hypothetical protein